MSIDNHQEHENDQVCVECGGSWPCEGWTGQAIEEAPRENTYWIGGQVIGPNFTGAFGQTLTITNGTLQPEHLGAGSELHKVVRAQYPERVRPTLQICVTSIYKFEDAS